MHSFGNVSYRNALVAAGLAACVGASAAAAADNGRERPSMAFQSQANSGR